MAARPLSDSATNLKIAGRCPDASFSALPALLPEFFAGKSGALSQGGKLYPCDLVVDASAEAAISAGNHVFAANDLHRRGVTAPTSVVGA
jgi:hypothetical protein